MKKYRKHLLLLFFTLLLFSLFLTVLLRLDPEKEFVIGHITLPTLIIFFIAALLFSVSACTFLFQNIRRGIFAGFFVLGILLLRFYHLANFLFVALLLGIFIALELFFFQKTKSQKTKPHRLE